MPEKLDLARLAPETEHILPLRNGCYSQSNLYIHLNIQTYWFRMQIEPGEHICTKHLFEKGSRLEFGGVERSRNRCLPYTYNRYCKAIFA